MFENTCETKELSTGELSVRFGQKIKFTDDDRLLKHCFQLFHGAMRLQNMLAVQQGCRVFSVGPVLNIETENGVRFVSLTVRYSKNVEHVGSFVHNGERITAEELSKLPLEALVAADG